MRANFCLFVALVSVFVCTGPADAICPYKYIEIGGGCFRFLSDDVKYADARLQCQENGGDLAVISDCQVFNHITHYIEYSADLSGSKGFWIGGTDAYQEGEWKWLDGTDVRMGSPFWSGIRESTYVLEPSGGTLEDCLGMDKDDAYYFHDLVCESLHTPLCQISIFNGSCHSSYTALGGGCFHFSTLELTWTESRNMCQSIDGDLAIVDDCNLMTTLIDYIQQFNLTPEVAYWLGGSDRTIEGHWTWLDGSLVTMGSPYWGKSGGGLLEPDGSGNCLMMYGADSYYFYDQPCDDTVGQYPLCQAQPL